MRNYNSVNEKLETMKQIPKMKRKASRRPKQPIAPYLTHFALPKYRFRYTFEVFFDAQKTSKFSIQNMSEGSIQIITNSCECFLIIKFTFAVTANSKTLLSFYPEFLYF